VPACVVWASLTPCSLQCRSPYDSCSEGIFPSSRFRSPETVAGAQEIFAMDMHYGKCFLVTFPGGLESRAQASSTIAHCRRATVG
jgi:hypothetical protein